MLEPALAPRPRLAVLVLAVALTGVGAIAWPHLLEELDWVGAYVVPAVSAKTGIRFTLHRQWPTSREPAVHVWYESEALDTFCGGCSVIFERRLVGVRFETVRIVRFRERKRFESWQYE
jgi:hypothetical protein